MAAELIIIDHPNLSVKEWSSGLTSSLGLGVAQATPKSE